MVLEMAPEMKGCAAAIMRMWDSTDRKRLPILPHGLAQSNTGRCSSFRKGAPSSVIAPQTWMLAASISRFVKPRAREHVEGDIVELLVGEAEDLLAELFAQRPLVEHELDVEGRFQRRVERGYLLVGEALGLQRTGIDAGRLVKVAVADRIGVDLGDLGIPNSRACAVPPARPG